MTIVQRVKDKLKGMMETYRAIYGYRAKSGIGQVCLDLVFAPVAFIAFVICLVIMSGAYVQGKVAGKSFDEVMTSRTEYFERRRSR